MYILSRQLCGQIDKKLFISLPLRHGPTGRGWGGRPNCFYLCLLILCGSLLAIGALPSCLFECRLKHTSGTDDTEGYIIQNLENTVVNLRVAMDASWSGGRKQLTDWQAMGGFARGSAVDIWFLKAFRR